MQKTAPVKKNQEIELTIRDISTEGNGIGTYQAYTLFVPKALPDEVVRAKVLKVGTSFGYAKVEEILRPSPIRQEEDCPAGSLCGGCTLQHVQYPASLDLKRKHIQDCLERIGGFSQIRVQATLGMKDPYHYRNKVQYPIRQGKDGQIQIGFFAPNSHRIIEGPTCCQQDEWIGEILRQIRQMMEKWQLSPYCEEKHRGLVRHCVIRKSNQHGTFHISLVINAKQVPAPLGEGIVETFGQNPKIAGVSLNFHDQKNNVIMGRETIPVLGSLYIEDSIGKFSFQISPNSFFQVNSVMTEVLYQKALEYANLSGQERVFDLYCGIGTISSFLAERAKEVIGVELVPQAIADAKENARRNGIGNADFYVGKAEEVLPKLYGQGKVADVVVVDPPRKGLEPVVIQTIRQIKPDRLVYVSCNPATLARDLRLLVGTDQDDIRYQVKEVQGVDMFARGGHVETVALLTLKNK